MIKITEEHGEIFSISINDEELQSDDGEMWHLPKGLVGDTSVEEIPNNVIFEVCNRIEDSTIFIDSVPFSIRKKNNTTVQVEFNDSGTRKYWDGTIGFKPYMEAKKAIVEERAREVGDVDLQHYEDDGAWIHLSYSAEIKAERLDLAIKLAEQITSEIEGAAEMRLGVELWAPNAAENEKEFTLQNVLPILRKLGFQSVYQNLQ